MHTKALYLNTGDKQNQNTARKKYTVQLNLESRFMWRDRV